MPPMRTAIMIPEKLAQIEDLAIREFSQWARGLSTFLEESGRNYKSKSWLLSEESIPRDKALEKRLTFGEVPYKGSRQEKL